jgi:hypothetical protein
MLRMREWRASIDWRKVPTPEPDHGKEAYLFSAVRHQLCRCQREVMRQPEVARYDLLAEDDRHGPSFERRMEYRDLLRRLHRRIPPEDWQLLLDYAAHGSVVSVWHAHDQSTGIRAFEKRVRRIRRRCRAVLHRIIRSGSFFRLPGATDSERPVQKVEVSMPRSKCFGIFWEAVETCKDCFETCDESDQCKHVFATETLVRYQEKLGADVTPQKLSDETGVGVEAILIALAYQSEALQKAESPPKLLAPTPVPEILHEAERVPAPLASAMPPPPTAPQAGDMDVPAPPPIDGSVSVSHAPPAVLSEAEHAAIEQRALAAVTGEPVEQEETVVPPKQPPRKKVAPRKKGAAPKKTAALATKTAPPKGKGSKKAPPKAAPKQAPPRKKAAPPKKKAVTANPPKARVASASRAKALASHRRATHATRAKAPAGSKMWDPKHDLDRWKAEHKRSPLIRMLPEGYVINRRYPWERNTGPMHRVRVGKQCYHYNGKTFPTLYAVMKEITGVQEYKKQMRIPDDESSRPEGKKATTIWSAAKFFGLAKIMLTLAEEKAGKGKGRRGRGTKKKPPPKKSRRAK